VERSSQIAQVRFLTPEIALVHERVAEKTGKSLRTYVFQKRGGRWTVESADVIQEQAVPGP
jgi:hypothetical protein